MKLTKAQQKVVDAMREGWELGTSDGPDGRAWLQKGGLGRGGDTMPVQWGTLRALRNAGVVEGIKSAKVWYRTDYTLTPEWKEQNP